MQRVILSMITGIHLAGHGSFNFIIVWRSGFQFNCLYVFFLFGLPLLPPSLLNSCNEGNLYWLKLWLGCVSDIIGNTFVKSLFITTRYDHFLHFSYKSERTWVWQCLYLVTIIIFCAFTPELLLWHKHDKRCGIS